MVTAMQDCQQSLRLDIFCRIYPLTLTSCRRSGQLRSHRIRTPHPQKGGTTATAAPSAREKRKTATSSDSSVVAIAIRMTMLLANSRKHTAVGWPATQQPTHA